MVLRLEKAGEAISILKDRWKESIQSKEQKENKLGKWRDSEFYRITLNLSTYL
jgi:hypothetical protein